jgi:hypothetical protein
MPQDSHGLERVPSDVTNAPERDPSAPWQNAMAKLSSGAKAADLALSTLLRAEADRLATIVSKGGTS